jgi:hypothetical protein
MSLNCGHQLFIPQTIYEHGEPRWNDIDRGKRRKSEKNRSSTTFPTTNSTWTDPGVKPGLHGERLATSRLSYGHKLTLLTDML